MATLWNKLDGKSYTVDNEKAEKDTRVKFPKLLHKNEKINLSFKRLQTFFKK